MKTVLITGATGFIGSHLAEALCQKNIRVRCITRPTSNLQWIQHLNVEVIHADLNNPETLVKPVRDSDVIFHLAGVTKALDQYAFQESNVIATQNLLKAALSSSPELERFVFVSSQAAAGPSRNGIPVAESDAPHPLTRYGKSKLEAERIVLSYSDRLPVTIVRPPSVFGPRDRDMLQIFKTVQFGFKPVLGRKPHYASFIFVEDIVHGLIQVAESGQSIGKTYFLATEQKISWDGFNNAVADVMGKRAVKFPIPLWLFTLIAVIRDVSSRITNKPDIINRDKVKEFRERFWICDSSQAEKDFQFHRSIDFETALEKTYKWYREHGWL
jgi:dihydroflavonol-4-reductase